MERWWKVVQPREEVRQGRSFNPDEFAIHLEQVVLGKGPADYLDPAQFFARNVFTRALRDHCGMVLRRLAGKSENTAPVFSLVTQFGGGKTHTLATLYHLARSGAKAMEFDGVKAVVTEAGLKTVPGAKIAVFVGNAWDPEPGRETPWIDVAYQLAGDAGVAALGQDAKTVAPGTTALSRVFEAAGGPVLILFDEVLNYLNRRRDTADAFHSFIQNLTVATTGTICGAAVISLPRSQVEMTDWDMQWQDKITKVVKRVSKDLIANDESEISQVIRRRLFEDLGSERTRKAVAKQFADWCFERRAQLPPEWTAVDTAITEQLSRDLLQSRFEACYPFHPATLSVFQRKWQALPQYQQTRGTLAMLAQWISWAYQDGFKAARNEPLITLGSAPLQVPEFRGVILGQLGEPRLGAAIDADIAGEQAHSRALDTDTKGPLKDIHRRVGTAILFESSGGQTDKVAHLPELRFALGEPDVDTTSVDTAALALEDKSFFIRRIGSDGFQIRYQPTLKKVVSDRRASLDPESEVKPTMRTVAEKEFRDGASLPIVTFPSDSSGIPDSPRLTLVVADPDVEWSGGGTVREQTAEWTKQRGTSPRLYPGSLVWCFRRPGRDFQDKVENWLAWQRVAREVAEGLLGGDLGAADKAEITAKLQVAQGDAKDEVWATYRYVVLYDSQEEDGLRVIDLGAGHSSASETLCGRVVTALKSEGLLNESVGVGYIASKWPPALKESGTWPLTGLRQSFLDGTLTRLPDADAILRRQVLTFVEHGDYGLVHGYQSDADYARLWFHEPMATEDVRFDPDVFLLSKAKAEALKGGAEPGAAEGGTTDVIVEGGETSDGSTPEGPPETGGSAETATIKLSGTVPRELWNRLGTKILPKLQAGESLVIEVGFSVTVATDGVTALEADLHQALVDLGIQDRIEIRRE